MAQGLRQTAVRGIITHSLFQNQILFHTDVSKDFICGCSGGGEAPPRSTWARMRTVSPSPQSGGCARSHLDSFQTPVEREVIRDEDPLCIPVTDNAAENSNQCTKPQPPAKNQPWKSRQGLSSTVEIHDHAPNRAFTIESLLSKMVIVNLHPSCLHARNSHGSSDPLLLLFKKDFSF